MKKCDIKDCHNKATVFGTDLAFCLTHWNQIARHLNKAIKESMIHGKKKEHT